jgi:CDP-diacylglycerol--glycerol-3-phosphate 3-phosphatidyltransferase
MNNSVWTLPNILSLSRLAGMPVLWIFAFQGKPVWVGVGALILLFTDFLDGLLARGMDQVTELGAKLDSFADNLLVPSLFIWLLMLCPEILKENNLAIFIVAAGTNLTMQLVAYLKFRRYPPNLHLYSAKVSAVFGTLFVLVALLFGFPRTLFYTAAGLLTFSNIEGILLVLTRSEVHENIGSIFRQAQKLMVYGEGRGRSDILRRKGPRQLHRNPVSSK